MTSFPFLIWAKETSFPANSFKIFKHSSTAAIAYSVSATLAK